MDLTRRIVRVDYRIWQRKIDPWRRRLGAPRALSEACGVALAHFSEQLCDLVRCCCDASKNLNPVPRIIAHSVALSFWLIWTRLSAFPGEIELV